MPVAAATCEGAAIVGQTTHPGKAPNSPAKAATFAAKLTATFATGKEGGLAPSLNADITSAARPNFLRAPSGPFYFRHTFTKDNTGVVEDFYDFQTVLGKGAYGSAHLVRCRQTGVERAVKSIAMEKVKDPARFEAEISIAKQLDHPNVVRLYETFRDEKHIFLVMELCTGGELFERIMAEAPEGFDEVKAATYVRQILAALCYLHANSFAHRDVKPENWLLQNRSPDATLKLIDFGLACQYEPGKPMMTKAGTPYYVAPEVLRGSYDELCDVWSVGVITYILLCGYPPFHGENDREVLRRVRRGTFDFPSPDWDHVSAEGKQLIRELLTVDPMARPSAGAALCSPWLRRSSRADAARVTCIGGDFMSKLQAFQMHTRLKRVALTAIAQHLRDDQIGALQSAFRSLDKNGDGMLSLEEIQEGLASIGVLVPPAFDEILRSVDSDGSGCLDYTEFVAATVDRRLYAQRDVCLAAFRTFDLDGDGKISRDELQQILGGGDVEKSPSMSRIERMVSEADSNGDGCIDFEEFFAMMTDGAHTHRGDHAVLHKTPRAHLLVETTPSGHDEGAGSSMWRSGPSTSDSATGSQDGLVAKVGSEGSTVE